MEHRNETFENVTVVLDGNDFIDCKFEGVVFNYSGGDLNMANCQMNRFSFQFGGSLANGLYALHQLFGTEGMLQILRGFTDPQPGEIELSPPQP
ncbi:hypothetical protein [Sphingomonas sp.]|jgi:hypothetical protein|uniref:hypothetical protein n=1 Tax=Sphingomonas sp. TaxID=28214 RepID=UPI002EDAFC08